MREESEGYSKLETELLTSMGNPHNNRTAQPVEPYVPGLQGQMKEGHCAYGTSAILTRRIAITRKRVESTLTNIKALIGYFDLDPARALDVILDVFADNILYHHVFFRELLRLSPWAPRTGKSHGTSLNSNRVNEVKGFYLPDGSLPSVREGANTICTQILGFKFAWYTVR